MLLDSSQHAKVTDFGISTTFGREDYTAETGTYRFMAPEVIVHKPYDYHCDVYSFGMVVWETLHGAVPFGNYQPLQAAFAVAMEGQRPDINLRKDLQCYEPLMRGAYLPRVAPARHDPLTRARYRPPCRLSAAHNPAAASTRAPPPSPGSALARRAVRSPRDERRGEFVRRARRGGRRRRRGRAAERVGRQLAAPAGLVARLVAHAGREEGRARRGGRRAAVAQGRGEVRSAAKGAGR